VRAMAELARDGIRPTVEIVGTGPLHASLTELAGQLGVADQIAFVGPATHEETLSRIASARLLCLPCRVASSGDRDAMPTAIIEAMMAGVPVVSTREVGIPEMVDDTCGRLVDPEDVPALAAAMHEILADPALGRRLGAVGAERARERYTVVCQVGRLARFFESDAGSAPAVRAS
jgi:colanic acid/amylovoran biosynthesis glycosyltransferase